jgi:bacitracin transport system permease protein
MTIPVSKIRYITGKYLMLFLWIMVLTLISWGLLLVLGILGQLSDLNIGTLVLYLGRYLLGGFLMYLLTTPFVFLTLWLKNLVPSIILAAVITMVNVAIINDVDFVALFPWSAVFVTANGSIHTSTL